MAKNSIQLRNQLQQVPFRSGGSFTRYERNIWKWFHRLVVPRNSKLNSLSIQIKSKNRDELDQEIVVGRFVKNNGTIVEVGTFKPTHAVALSTLLKRFNDVKTQGYFHELDNPIYTNFREFVEESGRGQCRNTYQALESALIALKQIPIRWRLTFKKASPDPEHTGKFVEETIDVIEDMNILSRLIWVVKRPKGEAKKGRREPVAFKFKFHDVLLDHLKMEYTLPANHKTLISLRNDYALIFFNHLEVRLCTKPHYTRWSKRLFDELNLTNARNSARCNREEILTKVKNELLNKSFSHGVLKGMAWKWHPDQKDFKIHWVKASFAQISKSVDKTSEVKSAVAEILGWVGETDNKKTKGFLHNKIKEHGLNPVYAAARRVKTDFIDNKGIELEAQPGYLLWKEIKALSEVKN